MVSVMIMAIHKRNINGHLDEITGRNETQISLYHPWRHKSMFSVLKREKGLATIVGSYKPTSSLAYSS
jgi:hypothetical protein